MTPKHQFKGLRKLNDNITWFKHLEKHRWGGEYQDGDKAEDTPTMRHTESLPLVFHYLKQLRRQNVTSSITDK